ncbi:MAG: hypothetical protein ACK4E8_07625 [Lacibacter sp.]
MKKNLFLTPLLVACMHILAPAQVVTGVYRGKMQVDSPRYDVNFELTLKERNGKLTGYCYRLFILGDTLYYNLVRVNARIIKDMLVVEDEKSVSNNFAESRRGIKTVFFFRLTDITDTAQVLPGEWSINQWRGYTPLTGKVEVQRERNYLATQMYQRLAEKNLDKEMLFDEAPLVLASNKKPPTQQPATSQPVTTSQPVAANNKPAANNTQQPATSQPVTTAQPVAANNKPAANTSQQPATSLPATTSQPVAPNPSVAAVNVPVIPVGQQPANPQPDLVVAAPTSTRDSVKGKLPGTPIGTPPVITNPIITKRVTELQQTLTVYEDTITLSLYDNGEIDGDTVSVFLNNEILVSKVGLSASAYKIQVPVARGQILQLTLYAENLGRIPPNTGLLVVYSGEQRYQIFFSSSLEKSAVILLRREEEP